MSGVMDNFSFTAKLAASLTKALDLDTPIDPLTVLLNLTLSNGTGTGQVSQMFHDTRTLTASATEDLDLAGGLTNAFGVTLTFTKLKFLLVYAGSFTPGATVNTNSVIVSRKATTGIPIFDTDGDSITLGPLDFFIYGGTIGKTITATTDDTLTFTNSAGSTSVDYTLVMVGTD